MPSIKRKVLRPEIVSTLRKIIEVSKQGVSIYKPNQWRLQLDHMFIADGYSFLLT